MELSQACFLRLWPGFEHTILYMRTQLDCLLLCADVPDGTCMLKLQDFKTAMVLYLSFAEGMHMPF